MKVCVICNQVEVKGEWKKPTVQDWLSIQKGNVQETVCPPCNEETDS